MDILSNFGEISESKLYTCDICVVVSEEDSDDSNDDVAKDKMVTR